MLYGEQVRSGKRLLPFAASVHLPFEQIFFFFYGSILHFSLFQVPGTPHSGCPTDSCATSPEMMRVLVAFPISLDSDHC